MVAGIKSERWPTSNRNPRPDCLGIRSRGGFDLIVALSDPSCSLFCLSNVSATVVAMVVDVFQLGPHRIVRGDATGPAVLARLLEGDAAAQRFRSMKTLQTFSSVHAQVHNHFNHELHLVTRRGYKQRRFSGLAEWRALAA
jgi:hypothetical protein